MAQTKKKKPAAGKAKKSAPAKKIAAKQPLKKMAAKAAAVMKKTSSATVPKKKPALLVPNSFQPLDDRIIISVEAAAEKTAGGIIIPGNASERPSRGTVLAAGPGKRNKKGVVRPLDVNVGDVVIFPQFAGQKIEIGADEFLILREEEILGITTA